MTTITIDRAVLEQALEALDCVCNDERTCDVLGHRQNEYHVIGAECPAVKRLWVAAHNLKEALNAPQPVNPSSEYERGFIDGMQKQMQSSVDKAVNQLAAPPQPVQREWVGLDQGTVYALFYCDLDQSFTDFARAIEEALKERNHE